MSNHGRLYGVSADHHSTGPEERHGEDVQQDDRQTAAGEGAGGTLSYCQHHSWGRGVCLGGGGEGIVILFCFL